MGAHGRPVEIPKWWTDLLAATMAAKGIDRAGLGRMLVEAGMVDSDTAEKKATAARVAVHRFFGGKPTAEIAELWRKRLGLPRFEFIAASRKHSEAMLLAEQDPESLTRMLAAGSLMMSLESGEHSLDEDRVVLVLFRKLRAASGAEYERALRLAVKSLQVASLRKNDRRPVDLTADSRDGLLV